MTKYVPPARYTIAYHRNMFAILISEARHATGYEFYKLRNAARWHRIQAADKGFKLP